MRNQRRAGQRPLQAPEEGGVEASAQASRWRRFARALWSSLKLVAGIVIVLGSALAVAWGAHRYATTTPRFALRELALTGNSRTSEARVRELGQLSLGENLFRVDLAAVEQRLLTDPWIEQVKVERRLPGALAVALTERQAVALAVVGDRAYLLTAEGEPFKQLGVGDPFDLPTVTGISTENLARDRARELERVRLGLEVLRQYGRVPVSQVHPAQEVQLVDDGSVRLVVGRAGTTLALGHGPWRKKLLMAAKVLGTVQRRGREAGIVFLDNEAHPERVVVRMR